MISRLKSVQVIQVSGACVSLACKLYDVTCCALWSINIVCHAQLAPHVVVVNIFSRVSVIQYICVCYVDSLQIAAQLWRSEGLRIDSEVSTGADGAPYPST